MSTLIANIGELVTNDPDGTGLGIVRDAALVIEDGEIAWTGPAAKAPAADAAFDAGGRAVLPGFVDSHAHLVFAGERAEEFAARMSGRPYAAGGIRTTVERTRAASDDDLRANLRRLIGEMARQGTTTVECKSGYGLTVEQEERAVRIAAELADEVTYLGAHVVPAEYQDDAAAYTRLAATDMLAACAPHARWVDVFCEEGAFDADQARAEGLGAVAFGAYTGVETALGAALDPVAAIGITVIALAGGLGMLACARGLVRADQWSRAPAVLTQLFALPVAWSLWQSEQYAFAVPLGAAAVLALVTVLSPPSTAWLLEDHDEDDGAEDRGDDAGRDAERRDAGSGETGERSADGDAAPKEPRSLGRRLMDRLKEQPTKR